MHFFSDTKFSDFQAQNYLEQFLPKHFVIKLPKLPLTEFTKIWEENFPLFLHLALHVDHLLLGGGDAERVQRLQQVLHTLNVQRRQLRIIARYFLEGIIDIFLASAEPLGAQCVGSNIKVNRPRSS